MIAALRDRDLTAPKVDVGDPEGRALGRPQARL
jgi:hypothetical protein